MYALDEVRCCVAFGGIIYYSMDWAVEKSIGGRRDEYPEVSVMLLYLIRHGATKGNIEKRYVGSTDETLTREAVERLVEWRHRYSEQLSQVQMVVVSPMKRCRQTADILFPGMRQYVVEDFRECDFGAFEYRNFRELDGNAAYQRFIDSCGECGFPGGEDRAAFQSRCVDGFEKLLSGFDEDSLRDKTGIRVQAEAETERECESSGMHIALVVHGGTIMALLDRYSFPHRDYYDWQTDNGTGFIIEADRDLETGEWKFNVIGTLDKVR